MPCAPHCPPWGALCRAAPKHGGTALHPREAPRAAAPWQGHDRALLQKQSSCPECHLSCHDPALDTKQGSMAPASAPSSHEAFHFWSGANRALLGPVAGMQEPSLHQGAEGAPGSPKTPAPAGGTTGGHKLQSAFPSLRLSSLPRDGAPLCGF